MNDEIAAWRASHPTRWKIVGMFGVFFGWLLMLSPGMLLGAVLTLLTQWIRHH